MGAAPDDRSPDPYKLYGLLDAVLGAAPDHRAPIHMDSGTAKGSCARGAAAEDVLQRIYSRGEREGNEDGRMDQQGKIGKLLSEVREIKNIVSAVIRVGFGVGERSL